MRRSLALIAILPLALVGSAFAKKQYVPPIYDHVGKVVESITVVQHDSEAHIDTQYGSADAYCDIAGTSITCSDSSGPHYIGVVLPTSPTTGNGDVDALTPSLALEDELTSIEGKSRGEVQSKDCWTSTNNLNACDPIGELVRNLPKATVSHPSTVKTVFRSEIAFRYRLIVVTKDSAFHLGLSNIGKTFYCLPFNVVGKKGETKQGESCYRVDQNDIFPESKPQPPPAALVPQAK